MTREEHLLTIAGEECAEVAQRCAKALRFGLEQVQHAPDDKPEENPDRLTNRARIAKEYSELAGVMEMLGLAPNRPDMHTKQEKVERYLELSRSLGTLAAPSPRQRPCRH